MNKELVERIAKVCHEQNKAYCEMLDDHSQVPWEDAPQWQVDSAITGVQSIYEGTIKTAGSSHDCWRKEKQEAGWVWGTAKDEEAKVHPCMVDFMDLPMEQQVKDHLFFNTATILIEKFL